MHTRTILDNGLTVLVRENHSAPVASFFIFYRVGSRNEVPGLTGISHWVEHMLFKGSARYPRGAFDKAVSRAGGVFNGMTSQDWTIYFETFPTERIGLALDAESDRMQHCLFDPAEAESERSVIINEREGSENSFAYLLSEEVQAAAFHAHPYRHPIIGWKCDLETMPLADLVRHYRQWYTPANAVAVAVGDFDADAMLEAIKSAFGAIPAGSAPILPRVVEPPQQAERRVVLHGSDPTSYFMLGFHAPGAAHPDFFSLVVMDSVLGGAKGLGIAGSGTNNRSNRLYKALVETRLAVDISSSYRPTIDPDLFSFFVTPAPGVRHEQIEAALWAEIRRVQEEGVTAEEVAKAIKQTRAQFAYSNESVTYQAYWLGFAEITASIEWLDAWPERLAAVTGTEVQRVARLYFAPERQTVGWYVPDEDAAGIDEFEFEDADSDGFEDSEDEHATVVGKGEAS